MSAGPRVTAVKVGSPPLSLTLDINVPNFMIDTVPACIAPSSRDLFFPEDYGLRHKEQIEEAKSLCDSCQAREGCLAWAVPQANLDGIWAGTTPPERRRIRVKRSKGNAA